MNDERRDCRVAAEAAPRNDGMSAARRMAMGALVVLGGLLAGCCGTLRGPVAREERIIERTLPDRTRERETIRREARGGDTAKGEDSTASTVRLDAAGLAATGSARKAAQASGLKYAYIGGVVLMAVGVGVGLWAGWSSGAAVIACGLAALVTARMLETYPWVGLIGGAVAVGAGGVIVWRLRRGKRAETALAVIVPTVEELAPQTQECLKGGIEALAVERGVDEAVKAEVGRVKKRMKRKKAQAGT